MLQRDLDVFLTQSRIKLEDWHSSNISWDDLLLIGQDHEKQRTALEASAISNASLIQRFSGVHSVRWRVKDSSHLMAKIVRRRAATVQKYMNISVTNYMEVVDDLIGLRALHIFKDDCFGIDREVRELFRLKEEPIAFIREGDSHELIEQYEKAAMLVKRHKDNYRSIHYILTAKPMLRTVNAELQVRTIFEEGWSEIDHKVRYPNFQNNQHLRGVLNILNGMAGQADDTGGLIQKLSKELQLAIPENQGSTRFDTEATDNADSTRNGVGSDQPEILVEDGHLMTPELLNVGDDAPVGEIPKQHITADPHTIRGDSTSATIARQENVFSATKSGYQPSSFTVGQHALDTHNAAMKALQSIDQVGAVVKAMEKRNVAMNSFGVLDEHDAAIKALQNIDQVGTFRNALNDQDAMKKALGVDDALTKALNDQHAMKKAMGGDDAVRKALSDQDAVKKAMGVDDALRKALNDQDAMKKALMGVNPPYI